MSFFAKPEIGFSQSVSRPGSTSQSNPFATNLQSSNPFSRTPTSIPFQTVQPNFSQGAPQAPFSTQTAFSNTIHNPFAQSNPSHQTTFAQGNTSLSSSMPFSTSLAFTTPGGTNPLQPGFFSGSNAIQNSNAPALSNAPQPSNTRSGTVPLQGSTSAPFATSSNYFSTNAPSAGFQSNAAPSSFTMNFGSNTGFSGSQFSNSFSGSAQPSLYGSSLQFEGPETWRYRKLETLPENFRNLFFSIQKEVENIEESLIGSQNSLSRYNKACSVVTDKSKALLSYSRKVLTLEQRTSIALEIKQKYENQVVKYVKELIKLCEGIDRGDLYNQVVSPAGFLADFCAMCDLRLAEVDESVKEVEELLRGETDMQVAKCFFNTILYINDKMRIVASLVSEVHVKIENIAKAYSGVDKELRGQTPNWNLFMIESKENTPPQPQRPNQIRDVISGKWYSINPTGYHL